MNQDMSITALVLQASLVVQLVMAGLLIVSLASWTVIFAKLMGLARVRRGNEEFERSFWSGQSLNELYSQATKASDTAPLQRIFASGMREFLKLRERRVTDSGALLDGARRAMRASYQRELDAIESNLSFLGSVGSVSPYVGLFGTVYGIMHAFVGLSNLQQVTLATVAPGIAEALVATAIGLFAAIPAVIAYNRFARDIDRIAISLETFIEEFSNILQRNVGAATAGGAGASAHTATASGTSLPPAGR
jgi:biopolymer transport protein TolQ